MLLTVHIHPNAKKNEIVKWLDETTIKIKIAAPAKEGRANKELIDFLAKTWKVSKSCVEIVRGTNIRMKHIMIYSTSSIPPFDQG